MRLLGLFFVVLLVSMEGSAQSNPFCLPIHKELQREAILAKFDSLYMPAGEFMSADTIPIAWYEGFRPAFEKHIASVNIPWNTTTNVWIDLCCAPSGRIERVLYASKGLADPMLEKQFCEAVEAFAKDYVFPLSADKRFSQCGTLRFGQKK